MTNTDKLITKHGGRVTAINDTGTVRRVEFESGSKASAFSDEATTDSVSAERQFPASPKAVVVTE